MFKSFRKLRSEESHDFSARVLYHILQSRAPCRAPGKSQMLRFSSSSDRQVLYLRASAMYAVSHVYSEVACRLSSYRQDCQCSARSSRRLSFSTGNSALLRAQERFDGRACTLSLTCWRSRGGWKTGKSENLIIREEGNVVEVPRAMVQLRLPKLIPHIQLRSI